LNRTTAYTRVRAFTLVELVLVMFIIGVLGAIAIPRFAQATARQQLNAAADRIVSDLNEARIRSRAASQSSILTFDTVDNSYQFNAVGGDATAVRLGESPYDVEISAADFGGSGKAVFNGYGVPMSTGYVDLVSPAGTARVQLLANGEASR